MNWSKVTIEGTHWSARFGHQAFAYDSKLWVLGGNDGNVIKNDIWWSADGGVTWTQVQVTRY